MASAGQVRAGRAFVEITADDSRLRNGLRRAEARLKAFGASVQAAGRSMMMMGTVGLAPLIAATKVFSSMGDQLQKMSARTGISVEGLSRLGYAATRSGTSMEAVETSVRRMQRSIYDAGRGLSTQVDALADLGLAYKDLDGLAPEDQFAKITDALEGITDPSRRAAISMAILGRAGTAIIPMLGQVNKLFAEAEAKGFVISQEEADRAAEFTDAMGDMWLAIKRFAFDVGSALAPALKEAAEWVVENAKAAREWVGDNKGLIITVLKISAALVALGAVTFVFGKLIAGIAGVIAGLRVLHAGLLLVGSHPVIAVIGLTAAALTAVGVAGWAASRAIDAAVESTRSLFEAGQKQRKSNMAKLNRLGELAKKQYKTNEEINEAVKLNRDLESVYCDLGISINGATGAIEGFADGMLRAVDAMHDMAAFQIGEQIDKLQEKLEKLSDLINQKNLGFGEWLAGVGRRVFSGDYVESKQAEFDKLYSQLIELEKKQARIRGYEPGAITETEDKTKVDAAAAAEERIAEKAAAEEQKMLDDLHSTYISHIEDEHRRNVKSINQRYGIEERRIREQYAESDRLNEMLRLNKMRRDQEIHYEIMRRIRERAEAEKQAAEKLIEETAARRQRIEEHRQRGLEGDEERLRTIREMQARLSGKRGLELQKELLKIEKERAQEAAIAAGESLELVEREYELRARLAEMQQTSPQQQIVGSWGSRGIRALEGAARNVQEKIEKNTKKAADKLDEIARAQAARPAAAFV